MGENAGYISRVHGSKEALNTVILSRYSISITLASFDLKRAKLKISNKTGTKNKAGTFASL